MKKYISFLRLRFNMSLQYRVVAFTGIITNFCWALMKVILFRTIYQSNPGNHAMPLQSMISYLWLLEAFQGMFHNWFSDGDTFESIQNGNVVYELCRPINLYNMWFAKHLGNRLAQTVLRGMPILFIGFLMPKGYRLSMPDSFAKLFTFLLALCLGALVNCALCMLIYMFSFFTISVYGIRQLFNTVSQFLSGVILPLAFFPKGLRALVELLPFASTLNAPLMIYSNQMSRVEIIRMVSLQIFWLGALVVLGQWIGRRALRRLIVQGG